MRILDGVMHGKLAHASRPVPIAAGIAADIAAGV